MYSITSKKFPIVLSTILSSIANQVSVSRCLYTHARARACVARIFFVRMFMCVLCLRFCSFALCRCRFLTPCNEKNYYTPKKKPFNDAEEEQLVGVLEFDNVNQVRQLISASSFVFEQAIYYQLSPQALDAQLDKVQLTRNMVIDGTRATHTLISKCAFQRTLFVNIWSEASTRVGARVRQRSLVPTTLAASSWRLVLRMAQSDQAALQQARGVVRFKLQGSDGGASDEAVDVEFTHDELSRFFQQLQTMQAQLDALRSN